MSNCPTHSETLTRYRYEAMQNAYPGAVTTPVRFAAELKSCRERRKAAIMKARKAIGE